MTYIKSYNIIVSGVGGQGVLSITRVIWKLCQMYGIRCQGSVFKGGAQRLGSIHSVLRLFLTKYSDYSMYSVQIPKQELDMIVGLEPWETLRYNNLFNKNTRIFMNTHIYPLLTDRFRKRSIEDPVETIRAFKLPIVAVDYTTKAINEFKTKAMTNYLVGLDAITGDNLPFHHDDYVTAFIEQVPVDNWIEERLKMSILGGIKNESRSLSGRNKNSSSKSR